MKVMRPEQARDFYEEDEDPARIEAVFETGEKGYTAPARGLRVRQLRGQTLGGLAAEFAEDIRNLRLRERTLPLYVYWQTFWSRIPANDVGCGGRRARASDRAVGLAPTAGNTGVAGRHTAESWLVSPNTISSRSASAGSRGGSQPSASDVELPAGHLKGASYCGIRKGSAGAIRQGGKEVR